MRRKEKLTRKEEGLDVVGEGIRRCGEKGCVKKKRKSASRGRTSGRVRSEGVLFLVQPRG